VYTYGIQNTTLGRLSYKTPRRNKGLSSRTLHLILRVFVGSRPAARALVPVRHLHTKVDNLYLLTVMTISARWCTNLVALSAFAGFRTLYWFSLDPRQRRKQIQLSQLLHPATSSTGVEDSMIPWRY
jgi:hypothetical protein